MRLLPRVFVFFAFASMSFWMSFGTRADVRNEIPDLPPDMEGSDYLAYLQTHSGIRFMAARPSSALQEVLDAGVRNLEWIAHMNQRRAPADKLSLSSAATSRGIPIDSPSEYNEEITVTEFQSLKAQLPAEMKTVLLDRSPFTQDPPLPTADYLRWGLLVDRSYQIANRWLMMQPYLFQLADRRAWDIRGYYFLSRFTDVERTQRLLTYLNLPAEDQQKIRGWLVSMCYNARRSISACGDEVDRNVRQGRDLNRFYEQYLSVSKGIYDGFFNIPTSVARRDMIWNSSDPGVMYAPFQTPSRSDVLSFLTVNIEDEWRSAGWNLKLRFGSLPTSPFIIFQPGVTPNVDRLGGNRITMDSNQPLTEYSAQWTIRHEFGHVLGFADCYVEFYEPERRVIVNYQVDIDNLMCSRRGHILPTHVETLRRAYFR